METYVTLHIVREETKVDKWEMSLADAAKFIAFHRIRCPETISYVMDRSGYVVSSEELWKALNMEIKPLS